MCEVLRFPVEGAQAPSAFPRPDFPPRPKPGTDADTALVLWWHRAQAIADFWNDETLDHSEEDTDRLFVLEEECLEAIARLPASTFPAMAVKVRMLVENAAWASGPPYCADCVDSLLNDLERGLL